MQTHPYGWLSLVPSLLAIGLAIITRRVLLAMFLGILTGAVITAQGDLLRALGDTMEIHLWTALIDPKRIRVFAFTIVMGAMVGVIERAGGMAGLVQTVSRWAHDRRRGQLVAWCLGLLIFFDDYANTLLLGGTLQPLFRRLRISREKLAYVVDSTAAPVAGLAIISTWVAGEIDFVQSGLDNLSQYERGISAFQIFIQSIPYRFYVLWSLWFVLLVAWMQRDFGPMWRAEMSCLSASGEERSGRELPYTVRASGWWNAVLPVLATIAAVLVFLYKTGDQSLAATSPSTDRTWWQIFGASDSYFALLWGSVIGLASAITLAWGQRLLKWIDIQQAMSRGAWAMIPALAVLWLASTLSTLTGRDTLPDRVMQSTSTAYPAQAYRLYTGEYLASLLSNESNSTTSSQLAPWLPTIVFTLAAAMSFATGTSWGTMAIVMPVAIPLAHGALVSQFPSAWQTHPVLIATIGSVLAGSIFGDHCSPISDTTVLSSQACGCDHAAHVWTQLPYALVVGLVSIVFGTLPIGFGWSVWLMIPTGSVALVLLLWVLGRPTATVGDGDSAPPS